MADERADLIQDIEALRRQLAAREAELTVRDEALASVRAELTVRSLEIEKLKVELARLRRLKFGRSSEKLDAAIA